MSAKKQLQAFYAAQGLTGKHRRAAMRYDMRQIKKHSDAFSPKGVDLSYLFLWDHTPQGWAYWYARDKKQ